ncbi:MAG: LTA synthase family protein [Clostridium lundense]|nr:LTA synthase family protein [Clostridium lundense]
MLILKNKLLKYMDVIFFIFILTLKILIYGRQIETQYFTYKNIFLAVFASVMIISSIALLFKDKQRANFLFILNIFMSLFIIADLNYFRYFKDVISVSVILNGLQLLSDVKSSVANLFKITDLFFLLDIVLIVPQINKYKYKNLITTSLKYRITSFALVLLIALGIDAWKIYRLSLNQPKLISTMYNRIYVAKNLGNLNYHFLDAFNSLNNTIDKRTPLSPEKEEEIKRFLQNKTVNTSSNLNGVGKGKNLIVIQVEALQAFVINASINGKEITPNLNKWINKSAYFNNYFYQTASGGTSDAEFLSINSLYPADSGAVTSIYYNNEFKGLPKVLKDNGYSATAFHGFRESFWNRNIIYPKYGFDDFYGEKSYTIDENIGLGLSDKSFLNQSLKKMKALKEPYYALLITLSSHHPYDDTKHYDEFNVAPYENTLLGDYLKAIHYTDKELGMFLDKLDKEGTLKNSILTLYGDHHAITRTNENELANFLNIDKFTDLKWAEIQKVPMFIHFPNDMHKGTYNIYGGQIDLYPTLANILGVKASSIMGKDLFNTKEGLTIFRNGSFTDGNIFYLSQQNTYYDIKSSSVIPETPEIKNKKESVLNQLEYSDLILKHNLLKENGD